MWKELKGGGGVVFGTCLNVGAAAFIREFQSSSFVWGASKNKFYWLIETEEKFLFRLNIDKKLHFSQMLFQSQILLTQINEKNENDSEVPTLIH